MDTRRVRRPSAPEAVDPNLFDHFAEEYARRDEVTGGFATEWLEGLLNGGSGEAAVDLGCGTGDVTALLARHYRRVVGVDLSEPMLQVARRRHPDPRISFERASLTEVTGEYDLVVSIMTLHHLPDPAAALAHVSSLVAPGGMAVLVDAAGPSPGSRWKHNRWAFLTLLGDVRRAYRKFRANTGRSWVEHLLADEFLSVADFEAVYRAALPGAVVGPTCGEYSAVWRRPG